MDWATLTEGEWGTYTEYEFENFLETEHIASGNSGPSSETDHLTYLPVTVQHLEYL